MDLDDLKKEWVKHSQQLENNLNLNEKLLKTMRLDKSQQQLQSIYKYEVFGLLAYALIIVFALVFSVQNMAEMNFLLMGVLAAIFSLVYIGLGIYKIRSYHQIDFSEDAIVNVQKSYNQFKVKLFKSRKWELIIMPFFVFITLAAGLKMAYNHDVFSNLPDLFLRIAIIVVIGGPIIYWSYKYFYDDKLKIAEQALSKLDEFENLD